MERALARGSAFKFLQSIGLTNSCSMDYGSFATSRVAEMKHFYCKSTECCTYYSHSERFSRRANMMVPTQTTKIRDRVFKFSSSMHHDTCPDCSGFLFTK